jgi:hypothetical protein
VISLVWTFGQVLSTANISAYMLSTAVLNSKDLGSVCPVAFKI